MVHVHPAALRLAAGVKGRDRVVLITDALNAAGLRTKYESGGMPVYVRTRSPPEGRHLGRKHLNTGQALRNMIKIGFPSEDVIAMLTETPARQIGVNGFKGRLAAGFDADINILDSNFNTVTTFIKGHAFVKQLN